jgi:hypothetical protein
MRKVIVTVLLVLVGTAWADNYEEAIKLIKKKKYSVAITLLDAERKTTGNSTKVLYALGYCYEKTNEQDKALKMYGSALIINANGGRGASKEEAEKVIRRLSELYPYMRSVLYSAWGLEWEATTAESKSHAVFLRGGAKALYIYALDQANWNADSDSVRTDGKRIPPVSEKALGYKQTMHKLGAKPFAGHWYLFVPGQCTWEEARTKAQEMGGYLATVTIKEEFDFLMKYTKPEHPNAKDANYKGPEGYVWLGGQMRDGVIHYITNEKEIENTIPRKQFHKRYTHTVLRAFSGSEEDVVSVSSVYAHGKNGSGVPLIRGFIVEWDR